MNRRKGLTLLEVLIAIFIMAIGMLALLTLFPVGALSMRAAIKDNRAAQAATNANAAAIALDLRDDSALTNPNSGAFQFGPLGNLTNLTGFNSSTWPSYPVYVDPLGNPTSNPLLGTNVSRVTPSSITTLPVALRYFSLLDDLEFDNTTGSRPGEPTVNGNLITRYNRFLWAYMIRRPRIIDPEVTELTVVVYSGRPVALPSPEPNYSPASPASAGTTEILLSYTVGSPPPLRVGGWIVDTTNEVALGNAGNPAVNGPVRSYFYRAVAVNDLGNGTMEVSLQTPLRASLVGGQNPSTVVVMDPAAEVFQRGTGWQP
jgi:prepilin-type N-terminal cleavage/methylation domain-containing protein